MQLIYLMITGAVLEICFAGDDGNESDGDASRKILGSSVVTSVSVVLDTGNKKNTIFTDAVGKPQPKPSHASELASPIDLLNPDRFEFYTFDDHGDLVKRLMTLDEIKRFIATGGDSDVLDLDSFTSQGFLPEKRVSDIVTNVQSVVKDEMEILKDPISKPIFDTPDVSDSWSMILPAVFGNSGQDIKPEKPTAFVTPDTIMLEPTSHHVVSSATVGPQKVDSILSTITTRRPSTTTKKSISSTTPVYYSSPPPMITTKPVVSSTHPPILNVEIISNGGSTTSSNSAEKFTGNNKQSPPKQDSSTVPTRIPVTSTTRPPLTRNTTKVTSQRVPSRPTTTQWSTTSFKPSSTQLNSVTLKGPATTQKTTTPDFVANIFGLPQELATSSKPSTTAKPSLRPISDIFGLPVNELKNNPRPVSLSSTSVRPTTAVGSSTSKINILPQLSTSSTIGNGYLASKSSAAPSTTNRPTPKYNVTSTSRPTWAPLQEDIPLFNIFKDVLNPSSSTTDINKNLSTSTVSGTIEDSATDSATINNVLNFESSKIQTTQVAESDLTTTATEKLQVTTAAQDSKPTTLLPPLLNSLNDNQKVSASELLDQLLFTTNIYEINTELDSSKLNLSEVNTNTVKHSEIETTTLSEQDLISYPPTTDASLIQSIEQLLSQAVNDVETVLINQTSATTQGVEYHPPNYGVINLSKEGETDLTTPTTTDQSELQSTTPELSHLDTLSDSMGAIFSQIAAENAAFDKFTEVPDLLGVTNRRSDATDSTVRNTAPTTTVGDQETISTTEATTQTEAREPDQESTTYYYVIRTESQNSTTEETLQLLNSTLLSLENNKNRTKPAKSDLSLEQEIIAQELKNISLLQNAGVKQNLSAPGDYLDQSESNVVSVNSKTSTKTTLNNFKNDETTDAPSATTTELVESTSYEEQYTTEFGTTTAATDTTESTTNLDKLLNEIEVLATSERTKLNTTQSILKPSIVITINENNTVVTDNGKLVANKTISKPSSITNITISTAPPVKLENNSTQDQTWTLVSTLAPQQVSIQNAPPPPTIPYPEVIDSPVAVDLVPKPMQGFGLEESTSSLDVDVHQFVQLCNELAFGFWKTVTTGLSPARSIFVSPFAASSMLAMVFLGAKGATSEEMNEILKLDDMVTFNPHLTFKSVSESIVSEPNSGIATAAIIRELFSDRSKGKLLDFYKNRVKAFYDGFAEEVSYREIGDVIRRRSNMLVKKYTNGKYPQFLSDASITARSPLSGVSINIFETDCSQTSTEGRDGELHFIIYPSMKQRRLVPVPAVVYKSGFLAGYEPSLDATAVAIGSKDQTVSTLLVVPGQQGIAAPGDGLARLEKRLVESSFKKGAWSRLLRSLIPRPGLEIQIPRFSHRSVINATTALQRMGLHELFNPTTADLRGLNGVANELHLSDVLQINKFATCGEKRNDETQHSEVYPATTMRGRAVRRLLRPVNPIDLEEPRDYQRAFHDPLYDPRLFELPLSLRPRQARIPDIPRLRFDRPFLYFVRHNPTGLILHMGRFNPRLLP